MTDSEENWSDFNEILPDAFITFVQTVPDHRPRRPQGQINFVKEEKKKMPPF